MRLLLPLWFPQRVVTVKIALNALLLSQSASYRTAGISQYIYELLSNLRLQAPRHRYEAFVSAPPRATELSPTPNFQCVAIGSRWSKPSMRILWEQLVQPLHLAHKPPDILHALGYALPLSWPGRSAITICDLSFVRYPELFNRSNAIYLATLARLSARKATAVVTISESTRDDVIRLFGVPEVKVTTTYCGVSERFSPIADSELDSFRSRHQLPAEFLLYVGTIEPRKNVAGLVRSYAAYRHSTNTRMPLVLGGGRGWKDQEVFDLVEQLDLSDQVLFPGYIPSEDLPSWYSAATAFLFPSRYEGFGLPVAEAMACGTPVITSNVSSLPEVVGEAGILLDPNDEAGLTSAMLRIASDSELRGTLSLAGRKRAARFRWDRMAEETTAVYERVMDAPSRSHRRATARTP